jgi:3-hydroxymyristoyl/3-hydroxydecanoyl-(acyl carrier protein) dehydratase
VHTQINVSTQEEVFFPHQKVFFFSAAVEQTAAMEAQQLQLISVEENGKLASHAFATAAGARKRDKYS